MRGLAFPLPGIDAIGLLQYNPADMTKERARLQIAERLLLAVLRENIGGWGDKCVTQGDQVRLGELTFRPRSRSSMGRFQLQEFPHWNGVAVTEPARLVELLIPAEYQPEQLRDEVEESSSNLELSLEARARRCNGSRLRAWESHRGADPKASCLAFFEQLVFLGHPLHPGTRLRKGMTEEQQRRWAPEWGVEFELPLLRLDPEQVVDNGFRHAFSKFFPDFDSDSAWLPMHPWQVENTLPQFDVKPEFRGGPAVRPTMSLRTLAPARDRYLPHFKTAVAVQTTGAVRTVSVQAAFNGPRLTRLLRRLDFDSPTLTILGELGAMHLDHHDSARAKHLSVVMRENPESHTEPDDLVMPAAALVEPVDGVTLMQEMIGEEDPLAWFSEYSEALLRPLLRLMTEYGVSLEGHLQNMVVSFRGGRPHRFFYRDFGGVRLFPERLQNHFSEPLVFAPGSATVTHEHSELTGKILYPVLQNHLGELIRALTLAYSIDESRFWKPVAEWLDQSLVDPRERQEFLGPRWRLKAMTSMRLKGQVTEYTYAEVENPCWKV